MENGNLLAPKNNNRSGTCFPAPDLDDKLTTNHFQQLMLTWGLTSSHLQQKLPRGQLCVYLHFCAGELNIFRLMENSALEKIAVICIFSQGTTRTEFGVMAAKPSLSSSAEGMWEPKGRDQAAAENVLQ